MEPPQELLQAGKPLPPMAWLGSSSPALAPAVRSVTGSPPKLLSDCSSPSWTSTTRGLWSAPRFASLASIGAFGASLVLSQHRRREQLWRRCRVQRRGIRRDLSLDGYPVHGPGYYWTLSKCTEAVVIYMPIADDVEAKDVIFSCRDWNLKLGLIPEKGGVVINDKVLYQCDIDESYFTLEEGQYGERCVMVWLSKYKKEQDWYAYDRFEPVTERFLTKGEKTRAELKFKITTKTFLDVEIEGEPAGRIVLGLYGDIVPRTVENFRCLCTGEKGDSKETGYPLHYKGTMFHRVIPGFCIQGGQTFENDEGSGGESIYGGSFEDESLRIKFSKKGMVAMANGGPDTNGSQFFITLDRAEHLSFKCVGFGEVLEGFDVVQAMAQTGSEDGEPMKRVIISNCGEVPLEGLQGSMWDKPEGLSPNDELRAAIAGAGSLGP